MGGAQQQLSSAGVAWAAEGASQCQQLARPLAPPQQTIQTLPSTAAPVCHTCGASTTQHMHSQPCRSSQHGSRIQCSLMPGSGELGSTCSSGDSFRRRWPLAMEHSSRGIQISLVARPTLRQGSRGWFSLRWAGVSMVSGVSCSRRQPAQQNTPLRWFMVKSMGWLPDPHGKSSWERGRHVKYSSALQPAEASAIGCGAAKHAWVSETSFPLLHELTGARSGVAPPEQSARLQSAGGNCRLRWQHESSLPTCSAVLAGRCSQARVSATQTRVWTCRLLPGARGCRCSTCVWWQRCARVGSDQHVGCRYWVPHASQDSTVLLDAVLSWLAQACGGSNSPALQPASQSVKQTAAWPPAGRSLALAEEVGKGAATSAADSPSGQDMGHVCFASVTGQTAMQQIAHCSWLPLDAA